MTDTKQMKDEELQQITAGEKAEVDYSKAKYKQGDIVKDRVTYLDCSQLLLIFYFSSNESAFDVRYNKRIIKQ